ncbi:MAG: prepilin-type N-terminal cleavage/methylation domain-containing protein [Parcubacteria group bacterium]|jgi:prepilin-type N-terminal cleavage/methylation domain-containing protein
MLNLTNRKIKSQRKIITGKRGFSLIEILIAMLIFVIMTLVVMGTFFDMISSRARVRTIQQDVEDARYSMELMAKTLRMSSVFTFSTGSIEFYDYSQKKCFKYVVNNDTHQISVQTTAGIKDTAVTDGSDPIKNCDTNWTAPTSMSGSGVNQLYFNVVKSDKSPKKLGHVTIGMKICYRGVCDNGNDAAIIQSSVSLRDYGYVNGS